MAKRRKRPSASEPKPRVRIPVSWGFVKWGNFRKVGKRYRDRKTRRFFKRNELQEWLKTSDIGRKMRTASARSSFLRTGRTDKIRALAKETPLQNAATTIQFQTGLKREDIDKAIEEYLIARERAKKAGRKEPDFYDIFRSPHLSKRTPRQEAFVVELKANRRKRLRKKRKKNA